MTSELKISGCAIPSHLTLIFIWFKWTTFEILNLLFVIICFVFFDDTDHTEVGADAAVVADGFGH